MQKFVTIGYFPSKKAALQALSEYHKNPVTIGSGSVTFKDVFDLWLEKDGQKLTEKNLLTHTNAFKKSEPLHAMKMRDIKADDMQKIMDGMTAGKSSQEKLKVMWSKLFRLAIERDIVQKDYSEFVRLNDQAKAPEPRRPFSKEQITTLWKNLDTVPGVDLILMMIYTGTRIGELLSVEREHLHLSERWIDLQGTKTKAAKRAVPIHTKILPLIERRLGSQYLCEKDSKPITYSHFLYSLWRPAMERLGFKGFVPHSTRHTAISLMTDAGIDERLIKKIVGHSSGDITGHYTHAYIDSLVREIDKIEI